MHLVAERDVAEDAADALGDAVVALVRAYRHALRHPVASALPALELALLLGEGELRLGELAARRGVCQSVVSRQVGELEARGLVVRRRDPADRRAGLVQLTPAGRELLAEAADTRRTWLHDALAHHPDDDVRGRDPAGPGARRRARPPHHARGSPHLDDQRLHTVEEVPVMTTIAERPAPATAPPTPAAAETPRSKREVLEALSGLLLAMFVSILSATIVSNALPTIIVDLHGSQTQYTWVVTATLLTTTASTPIWGKLADLFDKKLLVQIAIVIFVVSSAMAGLAESMSWLIGWRAVQGIGAGGLQALAQVVIAALIPPRERGRYSGYLGAVLATATVSGPLIGGLLVDTSWLGWRWCFYVGVPIGVIALVVLQRTLHVPTIKREVQARLPRRRADRRRRVHAADLDLAGRRAVRLGLGDVADAGRPRASRRWSPPWSWSCACRSRWCRWSCSATAPSCCRCSAASCSAW